jgi:hypothetical protein
MSLLDKKYFKDDDPALEDREITLIRVGVGAAQFGAVVHRFMAVVLFTDAG